jgi:transposase
LLIAAEAVFDGCYIVTTDLPESQMTKEDVVESYKKLSLVEKAFRLLKTVWLEIRPVFHKTDDRIRAHAFVCMLGYYLQWHMQQRLEPLFASDGRGKRRRWTFQAVMQCLQRITRNRVRIGKVEFQQVTTPDLEQQKVLDLLGVRL